MEARTVPTGYDRSVVAPFRGEHVARVADLHCRALPGLLSALGPAAVEAFYAGYLASPRSVAFVDERDGVLRGFVLGSGDPGGMRRDALRANAWRILRGVALSVLRRPRILRLLVGGALGLRAGGFDPRAPELTYIAVREDARGAGAGGALLAAFHSALRAQGIERYELSVEAANRQAVIFYERHGLRPVGSYRQFGSAYRRYALELLPAPPEKA
jgi:ribosomal protein S18 acetylase RimI-like enzyme